MDSAGKPTGSGTLRAGSADSNLRAGFFNDGFQCTVCGSVGTDSPGSIQTRRAQSDM